MQADIGEAESGGGAGRACLEGLCGSQGGLWASLHGRGKFPESSRRQLDLVRFWRTSVPTATLWVPVRPGCGREPGGQPGRSGRGVKGNPCPDATRHTRAWGLSGTQLPRTEPYGPRLESLTSHPNTARPRPVRWRWWGRCPPSGDAQSTAQVMAKECQGLWETEEKSGLARGRRLSGLNPPTRPRRGPRAPVLHVPTAESDGGPGLPSSGHTLAHWAGARALCLEMLGAARVPSTPTRGLSPTAGVVCFRGPRACKSSGQGGRHGRGTEGLRGCDAPLCDRMRPSTWVDTPRKGHQE